MQPDDPEQLRCLQQKLEVPDVVPRIHDHSWASGHGVSVYRTGVKLDRVPSSNSAVCLLPWPMMPRPKKKRPGRPPLDPAGPTVRQFSWRVTPTDDETLAAWSSAYGTRGDQQTLRSILEHARRHLARLRR